MSHKIIPTERQEQIRLHQWCKLKKLNSFSIPNGGTRHRLEAINLVKEGATKGVSDYCVILDECVLFIEMKRKKKKLKNGKMSNAHSKPSKEQIDFIDTTNTSKVALATVCYGSEEAIAFIESNLNKRSLDD